MSVEDSPEFKKALAEECERQYRGFMYGEGSDKLSFKYPIETTKEEIQRQRQKIETEVTEARLHAERVRREAEIMSNPHAREITENLRKLHSVDSGVICPKCGETNSHGNRTGNKPYCFRCQLPMMSREKAEKWIKPQQPKPRSLTFTDYDKVILKK